MSVDKSVPSYIRTHTYEIRFRKRYETLSYYGNYYSSHRCQSGTVICSQYKYRPVILFLAFYFALLFRRKMKKIENMRTYLSKKIPFQKKCRSLILIVLKKRPRNFDLVKNTYYIWKMLRRKNIPWKNT